MVSVRQDRHEPSGFLSVSHTRPHLPAVALPLHVQVASVWLHWPNPGPLQANPLIASGHASAQAVPP
jgi:hypothetical protein